MFVIPFAGEAGVAGAVGVDGVNLEAAPLLAAVRDAITFGGPAGADIVASAGGESADVLAVRIHDKNLRLAEPVGNERYAGAVR